MSVALCLDTSIQGFALTLSSRTGEKKTTSFANAAPKSATAGLPQAIENILAAEHLSMSDVTSLVVGVGPGSFTGIRIAIGFAQGFKAAAAALGSSLTVRGVSALECLARHQRLSAEDVLILPCTRTHVFVCQGGERSAFSLAAWSDLVQPTARRWQRAVLLGETGEFQQRLRGYAGELQCESLEWAQKAVVQAMAQDGNALLDRELIPFYLRLSTAEEKQDKVN